MRGSGALPARAGGAVEVRRAALVHDIGRVAVPTRIWQKQAPLSPDDGERVRLHAYHSERVLARAPFLARLAGVAACHHERLDGARYHPGAVAPALEAKIGVSTRAAAALFAMQHERRMGRTPDWTRLRRLVASRRSTRAKEPGP